MTNQENLFIHAFKDIAITNTRQVRISTRKASALRCGQFKKYSKPVAKTGKIFSFSR